jgi:hypothetical protein
MEGKDERAHDLDAAWRRPRWRPRHRAIDSGDVSKWEYAKSVWAGFIALALGVWLIVSGREVAGGIALTCIGCAALVVGFISLGRHRR